MNARRTADLEMHASADALGEPCIPPSGKAVIMRRERRRETASRTMDMSDNRALAQLEVQGLTADPSSRQQSKSAETRVAILRAAIECFANFGYARTSTKLIADTANVSRGAMVHHYPSRQELISAAIDYAFYRRMERYHNAIRKLSDEDRVERNAGMWIAWASHSTPEYKAYLELSIAARSDPELNKIFLPKARLYDKVWHEEGAAVFPEWASQPENRRLASNFIRAVYEGLILNREIWVDPEQEAALVAFTMEVVNAVYSGKLTFPDPQASLAKSKEQVARLGGKKSSKSTPSKKTGKKERRVA
jgi:AcrR family transcriptional regulator